MNNNHYSIYKSYSKNIMENKLHPRVPTLGLLPINPERISSGVCNPKQSCSCYPITPVYTDYGIYINQNGPPLPP
jgi:hypothetical protein